MSLSRREMLQRTTGLALAGGLLSVVDRAGAQTAPTTAAAKVDRYADAVFVDGPPPLPEAGSFTLAVLPDTQHYRDANVAGFRAQTDWIVANARDRRIAAVLHLGDITNDNTPEQWATARDALGALDAARLPYFLVPGNHDYIGPSGADGKPGKITDRTSGMSDSFPVARFRALPTFGGVYDREPEKIENSFHLFSAGGRDFVVICLEFGPRGDVVRWANEVAAKHADRAAILVTHAYLYFDDTRYDWKKNGRQQKWSPHAYKLAGGGPEDTMDGQELWDGLVSRHKNFILTLNGHVLDDGLGRLTSTTPDGRDVAQSLVNFQMRPNGGDGWLRLLEFKNDGRTIDVRDYSPTLNRQNVSAQNRFAFTPSPIART